LVVEFAVRSNFDKGASNRVPAGAFGGQQAHVRIVTNNGERNFGGLRELNSKSLRVNAQLRLEHIVLYSAIIRRLTHLSREEPSNVEHQPTCRGPSGYFVQPCRIRSISASDLQ
jgi:hypothetical protein